MDSQTLSSSSSSSSSSSFSLELRLIRGRNIFVKTCKEVFVRCYISTASNTRIKLESKQISSHSNLTWDQTFSLSCSGTPETMRSLKQGAIVFELRCRSRATFLSRMSGSKLLGRAEMAWNDVIGVPNAGMDEKWIVMTKDSYVYSDDAKPPAIQIATKVEELAEVKRRSKAYNCGCMDCGCNYCVDYDFFALGAVLEAL